MVFTIVCGIVLIIVLGMFMSQSKKEEVKPEIVIPKERPVLIELIPKGTSNNPFVCKVNDEILLEVKGYSDYKKQNEVKLEGSCITWKKSCPVGRFKLEYGVNNIYFTPATAGPRDLWIKYFDGKLNTSASLKIKVEV